MGETRANRPFVRYPQERWFAPTSDFSEQGAYSCRILVPGLSEIYPVEDLEWENNSVGNALRPAPVRLSDLNEAEAAALLTDLQTMNLNDERPLWEILGLAIPVGTPWKQLRIGELKTLLAAYDKLFAADRCA